MLKVCFIFILLCLFGCNSKVRKIDPDAVQEIRGYIKTDKRSYELNEPIKVQYILENATERTVTQTVQDASQDYKIPFQGYSFNALHQHDKMQHLELTDATDAFSGELELLPGANTIFCENTFKGTKEGLYTLSFDLRWAKGKKVVFTPINIQILPRTLTKEMLQEKDEELEQALENLASEDAMTKAHAKEKILEKGSVAIPKLILLMGDDNVRLQGDATFLLIRMGKDAVPALKKACLSMNRDIRMRSIYALGQIGSPDAIIIYNHVIQKDPDDEIRANTLKFVAENLTDIVSIPLLIQGLSDPKLEIRKYVIQTLESFTGETFDYDPESPIEQREKAIARWKAWMQEKS